METQTFITSRKKHGHTFLTAWRVQVESAEIPEAIKFDRWYKVLAPFITKVERWAIQSDIHLPEYPDHNWDEKAKLVWPDRCLVIHTKFGTACVIEFTGGSAIQGITVNGERKPKALTLGTWKKYGSKRGHGMSYLRAMAGLGRCSSPETGSDICEFEAVSWLTQGDAYAPETHKATSALYATAEAAS
jgi:hypothetical protein